MSRMKECLVLACLPNEERRAHYQYMLTKYREVAINHEIQSCINKGYLDVNMKKGYARLTHAGEQKLKALILKDREKEKEMVMQHMKKLGLEPVKQHD